MGAAAADYKSAIQQTASLRYGGGGCGAVGCLHDKREFGTSSGSLSHADLGRFGQIRDILPGRTECGEEPPVDSNSHEGEQGRAGFGTGFTRFTGFVSAWVSRPVGRFWPLLAANFERARQIHQGQGSFLSSGVGPSPLRNRSLG